MKSRRTAYLLTPLPALLAFLSLLALGPGCDWSRQSIFSEQPRLSRPYALDRYLYYLDRGQGLLLVVDPKAGGELIHRSEPLEPEAIAPLEVPRAPGRASRVLAILEPISHQLLLVIEGVDEDDRPSLELQRLPLSQLYDGLQASPDGRYLLAYHRGEVHTRDFLTVAGKVAVVDLEQVVDREIEGAVKEQVLDLEESPSRVLLSGALHLIEPDMPFPTDTCEELPSETEAVEDQDRHLALVVTRGRMAIVDLKYPELRARTLIFDSWVIPDRLLFAPDPEGHPRIIFNNGRTTAITSLTVSLSREKHRCLAHEEDPDEPELVVDYVELSSEVMAGDLAVLQGHGGVPTVIAPAAGRSKVSVLELRGSMMGSTVELEVQVSRVLRLRGSDGRDVALLYEDLGQENQVALMRIVDEDGQASIDLRYTKPFDAPVARVQAVPGNSTRVLIYLWNSPLMQVLDVDTGRATAAVLQQEPDATVFSASGSELFLVSRGRMANENYLVQVGLGASHALSSQWMLLDHQASSVSILEGLGLVVVDHGEPLGRITVVPAHDLRREAAWMIDGVFLHGILGEGR